MKTVTFKNTSGISYIQFEETQLIPQITRAEGEASKWENWFILNPNEVKEGNILQLGRNRDDQNPEHTMFITKVSNGDEFELHIKGFEGKLHSLKLTHPSLVAEALAETMHRVDTISVLIQEAADIYYKQRKQEINELR